MHFKVITDVAGTKCLPTVLFEKDIDTGDDFTEADEKILDAIGEREAVSFMVEINEGVKVNQMDFGMSTGVGAPSRSKSFTLTVK